MTNGEKFKEIFEVSQVDEGDYFAFVWFNHNAAEISIDWWNAEYEEPKTVKSNILEIPTDSVSEDKK